MKKAIVTILLLVLSLYNFPNATLAISNQTEIEKGTWVLHDFYFANLTSIINGTKQTDFAGVDISFINPYKFKLNVVDVFDKMIMEIVAINATEFLVNRKVEIITDTRPVPHVTVNLYAGTRNFHNITLNTESWENQVLGGPALTHLNWQDPGGLVPALGNEIIDSAYGIPLPDDFTVVELFQLKTPVPEAGDFSEPFIPVTSTKAIQRAFVDALNFTGQESLTSANNKILNLTNPHFSSPYPFFIHNNLTQIRERLEKGTEFVTESGNKNSFGDSSLIAALLNITKNSVEFTHTEETEGKFEIVFKSEFEYKFRQDNNLGRTTIGDSENPQYSYFYKYTIIGNTNTGILEHYSTDQIVNTTLDNNGELHASRYDRMALSFNNSETSSPLPTSISETLITSSNGTSQDTGLSLILFIIIGIGVLVVIGEIIFIYILFRRKKLKA